MEKENRKTIIYSILGLVVLIVIMIGVTYASFNYTKKGTRVNVITTGQLTMTYTESETNVINIKNANPTSDAVGMALVDSATPEDYFSFEIGTDNVSLSSEEVIYYEITAEKLTEQEIFDAKVTDAEKVEDIKILDNQYARMYLVKSADRSNYEAVLPPTSYTPLEADDTLGASKGEMVLYFDSFTNTNKTDKKYFKMAMWPSEEYNLNEEAKTFAVRVNVYASDTQVNKTSAITLNKNTTTLVKGTTETLTATINSGAKNRKLIWASSDTSVATVTENGVVTAVAPGNANITVRALDEADGTDTTATCQVTVTGSPANGITITETTLALTLGSEGQTLHTTVTPEDYANSGDITWNSSNTSVATVDATGKVTAVGEGSTNITASILGYTSNTCVVTVSKPTPNTITISSKTASVERGKTTTLTATVQPTNSTTTQVDWTTSDSSIATVDGNGVVTGVGIGTATITATSQGNSSLTDTAEITVTKPSATSVGLNTSSGIKVGASTTFIATLYDENNNEITSEDSLDVENNTITWTSGDTSITGDLSSCLGKISCEIEALSEGSTNLTVTVNSGAAASRTLSFTAYNLATELAKSDSEIFKSDFDNGTIIPTSNKLATGTTHSNYRYTSNGNNAVNNYVWFNCDNDVTPSESTCEKWRIVGSFDGIYSKADSTTGKPSGNAERRVKLMRSSNLGINLSWDTSDSNTNSGNGVNKWEDGDLMKLLNPNHNTNTGLNASGTTITINNSLYWNRATIGNCYTGQGNAVKEDCSFATIGLKDTGISTTKNMIGDTYWNLGGHGTTDKVLGEDYFLQNTLYVAERGDTTSSGGALYWVGKVALNYPSDYAYAGYNCTKDYVLADYNYTTSGWGTTDVRQCNTKNWMYNGGFHEWFLSPSLTASYVAWYLSSNGVVDRGGYTSAGRAVRPAVYLKSNVIVKKQEDCTINGTTYARGSEQCPYNIQLGS